MARRIAHRSVEQLFDDRSLADDNPLGDVDQFFDQVGRSTARWLHRHHGMTSRVCLRDEPERPSNVVALPLPGPSTLAASGASARCVRWLPPR
jgi:hypothetical protein